MTNLADYRGSDSPTTNANRQPPTRLPSGDFDNRDGPIVHLGDIGVLAVRGDCHNTRRLAKRDRAPYDRVGRGADHHNALSILIRHIEIKTVRGKSAF